jgi:hypothetical protein
MASPPIPANPEHAHMLPAEDDLAALERIFRVYSYHEPRPKKLVLKQLLKARDFNHPR